MKFEVTFLDKVADITIAAKQSLKETCNLLLIETKNVKITKLSKEDNSFVFKTNIRAIPIDMLGNKRILTVIPIGQGSYL